MIKVSVIVPVYNTKSLLRNCVESLLAQTLYDIEIILIDDASTDGSCAILEEYAKNDSRINVIYNNENIGAAESRNKGILAARGKYIQFVDADDYLDVSTLENLYLLAVSHDLDMCYLGMHFHKMNDLKETSVQCGITGSYLGVYTGLELIKSFTANKEFFLYLCSVFYKTSFIRKNQIYFKNLLVGEGGDFILHALCNAQRVEVCEEKYYHYRVHKNSVMHSVDAKKELLIGQIVQYVDMLQYLAQNENAVEMKNFLDAHYRKIAGGIKNLSIDEQGEIELRLGTDFAKHIFGLLQQNKRIYGIEFEADMLLRMRKKEFVIVYGAGYASKEIIELLQQYSIEIVGFAVTERKAGQKSVYGHHVYEIKELISYNKKAAVLIGANKKYNEEIQVILEHYGFDDYIFLNVEI